MLELFASLLEGFGGAFTRSGPSGHRRALDAYKRGYEEATRSGDWSPEILQRHLKERSVEGAYREAPETLTALAHQAWLERQAPKQYKKSLEQHLRVLLRDGKERPRG